MVYGRVYSIRSHQTTDIYIGSTKQTLSQRITDHRGNYKRYLNKIGNYVTSFEILKYGDAYIEILFEGEFESKYALKQKEGKYQREMDCVNKNIAGRTYKEWEEENKEKRSEQHKKWEEENKEKRSEQHTQYRKENKPQIAEKQKKYNENHKEEKKQYDALRREKNKEQLKQRHECKCGGYFCIGDKSKHEKTKKHLAFLQNA